MERLRRFLLVWNVAPLLVVCLLCYLSWDAWEFYKANAKDLPEWHVAGLFTYLGALCAILFKIYENLQKDRG